MNNEQLFLRAILQNLDKSSFQEFCFSLLQADYKELFSKYDNIGQLDESVFKWRNNFVNLEAYSLFLTHYYPFELFKRIDEGILDEDFHSLIKKVKEHVKSDGELFNQIRVLTNISGYTKEQYTDIISPLYEKAFSQIGLDEEFYGIGSLDSFVDNKYEATHSIFCDYYSRKDFDIIINFSSTGATVNKLHSSKYIKSGVLQNSYDIVEPLFLERINESDKVLFEFEKLINSTTKESELEEFIKEYYRDIFGPRYNKVETQVLVNFPQFDINDKNRRLDIFLRNAVSMDWEIYEVKRAIDIICQYRGSPSLSADVYHAIEQVSNYGEILAQDTVKKSFEKIGIQYYNPTLNIIIGSQPSIKVEQWRRLMARNLNNVNILTFDTLQKEMQYRYEEQKTLLNDFMKKLK